MRRREFITLAGAAVSASMARAQQSMVPVIGFLSTSSSQNVERLIASFRQGLREQGFVEGSNISIDYRWGENQNERLPALAADLAARKVALIAAGGGPATIAAKDATATIPIVFATGNDPVATGIVASFSRPGGNATGTYFFSRVLESKRLELIRELQPAAMSFAYLGNPSFPLSASETAGLGEGARALGVNVTNLFAANAADIDRAFSAMKQQGVEVVLIGGDPMFQGQRNQIVALAARNALPTIYPDRQFPEVGGLMSYGSKIIDHYRLMGVYAGRILKGDKPADLPVQQSTIVELVINLKSARALGLTFPISLLGRADEVIE